MTIGIYRLVFNGTNKCYIGQSINIEKRYLAHISTLIKGLGARKLQQAFNIYGKPSLEIVEICAKEQLSELENKFIKTYDSYISGFNSLEFAEDVPKNTSSGIEGPGAKYSKKQILEVFYYITDTTYTADEIESLTFVSKGIIYYIKHGKGHLWLKDVDPIKYTKYIENREHGNACATRGTTYPKLRSPDGTVFNIVNRNKFANEHKLDSGALGRVLRGVAKSHKGWKLCPEEEV